MKNKPILLLLVVFLLTPLIVSSTFEGNVKVVPIFIGSLDRAEVNEVVEKSVSFYVKEYSVKENIPVKMAETIIMKALTTNVPINLAFALAKSESGYNPTALNKSNADGSYDYGLFQLNSLTFGDVKKNLADINKNTNVALTYLKELHTTYGSYDLALVAYNCGKVRRFNDLTQAHVKNILKREDELDQWFNSKYRDTLSRGID